MKSDIHPNYYQMEVTCSCGNKMIVGSSRQEKLSIEVCDQCHPFYTGQQRVMTTSSVEKYRSRYEIPRPAIQQTARPATPAKAKKTVKKVAATGTKAAASTKTVKAVKTTKAATSKEV